MYTVRSTLNVGDVDDPGIIHMSLFCILNSNQITVVIVMMDYSIYILMLMLVRIQTREPEQFTPSKNVSCGPRSGLDVHAANSRAAIAEIIRTYCVTRLKLFSCCDRLYSTYCARFCVHECYSMIWLSGRTPRFGTRMWHSAPLYSTYCTKVRYYSTILRNN